MDVPRTWRELLGRIIQDVQERRRLAETLGVNSVTLTRWVTSESTPRQSNLHRLVNALPHQRDLLLPLIQAEFKTIPFLEDAEIPQKVSPSIPAEFYRRVTHLYAYTPTSLRFTSACDLIVQQALKQLDPDRLGMAVIVARCLFPLPTQPVRSLLECYGWGTPPWREHLEQQPGLLGAESLAGWAAISGHLEVNQRLRASQGWAPGYASAWEQSAAAMPILRGGELAGVFLVSSTVLDIFTPDRLELIEQYAELLALAFEPGDFYPSERIRLLVLPPAEQQRQLIATFSQRVIALMREAAQQGHSLSFAQAERQVWQHLEEVLASSLVESRGAGLLEKEF